MGKSFKLNPPKLTGKKGGNQTAVLIGAGVGLLGLFLFSGKKANAKPVEPDFDDLPIPPQPDVGPGPSPAPKPRPKPAPTPVPTPTPSGKTTGTIYPPPFVVDSPDDFLDKLFTGAAGGSAIVTISGSGCAVTPSFFTAFGGIISRRSGQAASNYIADVVYFNIVQPPAPGYDHSFDKETANPTAVAYIQLWENIRNRAFNKLKSTCGTTSL